MDKNNLMIKLIAKCLLLFVCCTLGGCGAMKEKPGVKKQPENGALKSSTEARVWATAISKHKTNGTSIVYRYIKEFEQSFSRSSQPDRVIIVWRYSGENGMPSTSEREKMENLEDSLGPEVESKGFSTLALVSTGNNLREWTYYTKSESEFLSLLNKALKGKPVFPIEIHTAPDPEWKTYSHFIKGVKND